MNQASSIGFGSDTSKLAGYAFTANDRLGNIDFVIENTSTENIFVRLREYTGLRSTAEGGSSSSSTSGYANASLAETTVVAGGTKTLPLVLLSKQIGIFGSGATGKTARANISTAIRNKANLRGADISIVPTPARQGYGFDLGTDINGFQSPGWGSMNSSTGDISGPRGY